MLDEQSLDRLFRQARTHASWLDQPVTDAQLHEIYELMKWAPTSSNTSPGRIVFVRSREAKERLRPALSAGNVDKTMAAPVTAILAYDLQFYEKMPKLLPQRPERRESFARSPEAAERIAVQNGTLQAGYFILAARALGFDCGPMGGFDNVKVDATFFAPGTPHESYRSNILCNLGYGDPAKLLPRNPRLDFEEACSLL
jgi:3-hydroxypropanoate dehydrogenase